MNYQLIDHELEVWAKFHNLKIVKLYKDMDVRSVNILDESGDKYQIWIDQIKDKKNIKINYWDYKDQKGSINTDYSHFFESMEKSYEIVKDWMKLAEGKRSNNSDRSLGA